MMLGEFCLILHDNNTKYDPTCYHYLHKVIISSFLVHDYLLLMYLVNINLISI